MVVDCGGGTVDITVHEMESKAGNLIELYKATGGPYGSVGKLPQLDLDPDITLKICTTSRSCSNVDLSE